MTRFGDVPVGTPLVRFDDGSAIVKGDGSDAELHEMARFFADMQAGTIDPDSIEIIKILRREGVAVRAFVPEDARAMSGEQFELTAELAEVIEGVAGTQRAPETGRKRDGDGTGS